MPNRTPPRHRALAFVLACVCIFSTLAVPTAGTPQRRRARPARVDCATVTDADIVKAIQDKIKADRRYKGQWTHINVSSRERVVTLEGYAFGKGAVGRLVGYANSTQCVVRVVSHMRNYLGAGCGPNEKPCGDGCIAKDSDCNIISFVY
jgi:hypothetical protein